MSSRERWTVYPLLFLTLGIALKDKVTRQVNTGSVVCKSLLVTDPQGKPQVLVGSTTGGGVVQTRSRERGVDVIVGHYNQLAGLFFTDANDKLIRPSIFLESAPPKPAPGPRDTQEKKRAAGPADSKLPFTEEPDEKAADDKK